MSPRSLRSIDLIPKGPVHPSPADWRDQVLYFLLPDRFSDGKEDGRPLFDRTRPDRFRAKDKAAWMASGKKFQGGTIQGVTSKIPYLKDLGITALWIGPIWRQRKDLETYHGYGIQNFLEVDPRFGTAQDLRGLVDRAHRENMYVLLDVIYNHTGNNWFYNIDGSPAERVHYRFSPPYDFHGWRSADGKSIPTVTRRDDGIWPEEFQRIDWYTRAGEIGRWDPEGWENPMHPDCEFRRGDFFDLKDLNLGLDAVLSSIIRVYQYWIALSDCDGFRIDTVKHVSWEASKNFCGAIREYAESIGKENFLLLGEVTGGGEMARNYLDVFGRNIDAVLDIGEPSRRLAEMVKGFWSPAEFFNQFKGHDILGSHRETGRYHVSILDDHDMVGKAKRRFSAGNSSSSRDLQAACAVGVQLTTLGIPCIYYGTEQALDGSTDLHDREIEPLVDGKVPFEDRYIRESLFGSDFGAFETEGCHFFDPSHPAYLRIAAIARLRSRKDGVGLALRRGRQYPREISIGGAPFALPGNGEIAAWSRILFDQEVLVAINTNGNFGKSALVTVDTLLHPEGSEIRCLYRSDWSDDSLRDRDPPGETPLTVVRAMGRSAVHVDLPSSGMAILA